MQTGAAIRIARDRFHLAWDPAIEAIETVENGTVVEFDLLDASGGQLTADSTVEDLARLDFNRVDQVNGPIAVAGAEPGDTLQVDLLEFEPADWGWTASIPGFGLLADDFPDPALRISRVPGVGGRAEFLPGVHIPIVPFCGDVGVAPPTGPRSTIPPDLHGGNMDTRHLTAGSTLYLPVFHAGARISMGDGHAAQGDGEVCGTAIEVAGAVTVRFALLAGPGRRPRFPTYETPARPGRRSFATTGIPVEAGMDLNAAAREALLEMLDHLEHTYGFERPAAYALCSAAVDLRLSEVVDVPYPVVSALLPLDLFERG